MITIRPDLKVLVAAQPVDFRKGMDALAGLVAERLSENSYAGTIFVFRSKRADRVKILAFDGTGLILATKRLSRTRLGGGSTARRSELLASPLFSPAWLRWRSAGSGSHCKVNRVRSMRPTPVALATARCSTGGGDLAQDRGGRDCASLDRSFPCANGRL